MAVWYHGRISREAAEQALADEAKAHPPAQVLYLVRHSTSNAHNFVLTWMKVKHCIGNSKIKVSERDGAISFTLDIAIPGKTARYFGSMDTLLEYYQDPTCGLPEGYLQCFVPCEPPVAFPTFTTLAELDQLGKDARAAAFSRMCTTASDSAGECSSPSGSFLSNTVLSTAASDGGIFSRSPSLSMMSCLAAAGGAESHVPSPLSTVASLSTIHTGEQQGSTTTPAPPTTSATAPQDITTTEQAGAAGAAAGAAGAADEGDSTGASHAAANDGGSAPSAGKEATCAERKGKGKRKARKTAGKKGSCCVQ